jgi:DNA-binding transcriptional LysR family regulator
LTLLWARTVGNGRLLTFEHPVSGPEGDFSVYAAGTLEINSPDELLAAASNGHGFSLTPVSLVVDKLKSGAFVDVLSEFLPHYILIANICRRR